MDILSYFLISYSRGNNVVMEGWIELPKFSEGYIRGIRSFLQNAFSRYAVGDEITCPCKKCDNHGVVRM